MQRGQKGNRLPFATSYLSPFGKLVKGNGAPHANPAKFQAFVKRAHITFEVVAKSNLLPFGI